jgi:hypothetical protein
MIPVEKLKTLVNQIAYARLIKDLKKLKVDVTKLKIPKNKVSGHLVGTRVKSVFQAIFKDREFSLTKKRYFFCWSFSLKALREIGSEEYEFYGFFCNHPDIKRIEKKYGFSDNLLSKSFTVFSEKTFDKIGHIMEYNPKFLKEIKKYQKYSNDVLDIYPEIERQWKNRLKIDIQKRYNKIAARRRKEP